MNDLRTSNVEQLRVVSNNLENDLLSQFRTGLFPGWDSQYDGERGKLIREAARAILAENISPDEGTYVSHKSISALIHYIADMIE